MAFFDELKQKVMSGSKQVADKAKEVADTTKLKGQIAAEKGKIKEAYSKLGELYYAAHKEETPEAEEMAEQFAAITTSLEAIDLYENEIEKIKEAAAEAAAAREAQKQEAAAKLEEAKTEAAEAMQDLAEDAAESVKEWVEETAEKAEEVVDAVEETTERIRKEKYCAHCGAKVSEDASFCSSCGNPLA